MFCQICLPYPAAKVAKIESERLLGLSVQMELARRKQAGQYAGKFEAQYHYFGYEGRCALPCRPPFLFSNLFFLFCSYTSNKSINYASKSTYLLNAKKI